MVAEAWNPNPALYQGDQVLDEYLFVELVDKNIDAYDLGLAGMGQLGEL